MFLFCGQFWLTNVMDEMTNEEEVCQTDLFKYKRVVQIGTTLGKTMHSDD